MYSITHTLTPTVLKNNQAWAFLKNCTSYATMLKIIINQARHTEVLLKQQSTTSGMQYKPLLVKKPSMLSYSWNSSFQIGASVFSRTEVVTVCSVASTTFCILDAAAASFVRWTIPRTQYGSLRPEPHSRSRKKVENPYDDKVQIDS